LRGMCMLPQPDIMVHDRYENLALVIELKPRQGADAQWAAETRQIILQNELSLNAPYFMLATLDHLYLWKGAETFDAIKPDYVVDAEKVLAPYLRRFNLNLMEVTGNGFELLISTWLEELVKGQPLDVSSNNWLIASQLLEKIQHGRVTVRDVA
jgi:hypothetical protein